MVEIFRTLGLLGLLGLWDFGNLGLWDFGTLGLWDFGTLLICDAVLKFLKYRQYVERLFNNYLQRYKFIDTLNIYNF
tara:strand:+ start:396 stop:626 length:231 start_codon:yes stop_codon:yes gene_type:complete